ncbi:MAG: NAD(P)H-dependent oxidoreductase subunit E [Syntrophomonadaceae bacterium]|nr:NAD(P)H-dependent oxidoreductase subunit E [Syntrophomonadaceae bacterium]
MADYKEIVGSFRGTPGGIIEAFHALQNEFNYIPKEAIAEASRVFGVSEAQAYGVATFYSYLSTEKKGQYIIRICESAPCHIAGADEVIQAIEKALGVRLGETTPDGKFSFELTECIGQCQETPVISINSVPYVGITPADVPAVLAKCR